MDGTRKGCATHEGIIIVFYIVVSIHGVLRATAPFGRNRPQFKVKKNKRKKGSWKT
jgi:hypothetical protein